MDTTGHALYQRNDTQCILMFVPTSTGGYYDVSSLDMHWAVNIPTNFLFGIGSTLVTATIFEFVSAQSPSVNEGSSSWNVLCSYWYIPVHQFSFTCTICF